MYWRDINHTHHGQRAIVWADSTPYDPEIEEPPVEGIVSCPDIDSVPVLLDMEMANRVHTFAGWYQVSFVYPRHRVEVIEHSFKGE